MKPTTIFKTEMQTELSNCNFVKTALMIVIVLYHSIVFWTGSWFSEKPAFSSDVLSYFATWLNSFHVHGFTLVSGYLFYFLKFEKRRYDKFFSFVVNKGKRLLVPYVFVAVIWVIPISVVFFKYDFPTVINKYVLATSPSQLWFLVMLFDLFVISWLLSGLFEKHDFIGLVIVIGFFGLSIIGRHVILNVFMIWTACEYLPLFWLGFKIRQHGSKLIRKIPVIIYVGIDILMFIAVQYLSSMNGVIFKLLNIGLSFFLNIVGALMAFVVFQKIAEHVNWQKKYFMFFSKSTMTVYLFHQQVIYFFIYLLNGVINPYLNATVNFVVAIGVSLLIAMVLMRFKLTRFLIGEK